MKIDINILKENLEDFEKYNKLMVIDEQQKNFTHNQDVVSPDSYYPVDENFPFIRKGFKWAVKTAIYNKIVNNYSKAINKKLINLKVVGRENLKNVKAAIVTCNHISKVDSFAVRGALNQNIMYVAAEHNNWKGPLGTLARNTGYIPLPPNLKLSLMKKFSGAIEYYLKRNKKILFYPEQSMWREYKKPRPLQNGTFHYAVINNVPILPLFITLTNNPIKVDEQNRVNYSNYTIHILPPIYINPQLTPKQNEEYLKKQNFLLWQQTYEQTYGIKLNYN